MKKRYTKKQIMESIAYWKKQLKVGNYRKLNESLNKHGIAPDDTMPDRADAICTIIPMHNNIENDDQFSYPVTIEDLVNFLNEIKRLYPEVVLDEIYSRITNGIGDYHNYPNNIGQLVLQDMLVEVLPLKKLDFNKFKNNKQSEQFLSISQERIGKIGKEIEQNVRKAFDRAEERGRSIIPGDPIVDEDNRDDLEEDVLDKLFGGGNNPSKNDIGAENAWNLYGDLIPCDEKEFKAFYEYVKENGY